MESEKLTKIQIAVICALILNFAVAICGVVLVLKEEARNAERAATTSIQISELVETARAISKSLSNTSLAVENVQLELDNQEQISAKTSLTVANISQELDIHEDRFTELVETDGTIKKSLSDTGLEVQNNQLKLDNHEDRFTELVATDGAISKRLTDTSLAVEKNQLELDNHEEIFAQTSLTLTNISQELENHEDLFTGVSNCTQLKDQGITKSGYYQLRIPGSVSTVIRFCDFEIYTGVTTCVELGRRIKVKSVGRYFLRSESSDPLLSNAREVICSARSTCNDLFLEGVMAHGNNTLNAVNSEETFDVHCRQTDNGVTTEIWHAQMGEIQNPTDRRCEPGGCYSWTPQYEISRDHILGVIAKSSQCRQYIKARCVQLRLLTSSFAWWVSQAGEKMRYWGGATSRRDGYCACGETGSCLRAALKCNCDANDGNEGTDEGYLTDKTKLPVRELRFGDLVDTVEFVWHTLGKLECWGQA